MSDSVSPLTTALEQLATQPIGHQLVTVLDGGHGGLFVSVRCLKMCVVIFCQ